jgi:hypothetical protein
VGDDTRVLRVSLSGAGRLRWAAVAEVGCGGLKWVVAAAVCSFLSFFSNSYFQTYSNSKQISNSNQDLNPNTQKKQCTNMNATVNSYISLIN